MTRQIGDQYATVQRMWHVHRASEIAAQLDITDETVRQIANKLKLGRNVCAPLPTNHVARPGLPKGYSPETLAWARAHDRDLQPLAIIPAQSEADLILVMHAEGRKVDA